MIFLVKICLALIFQIYAEAYPYFPSCSSSSSNILTTLNGKISGACYNVTVNYGSKPKSYNQVMTWLGVPYASPPVGNLRFAQPVPIGNWNSVLNGTNWPSPCIQIVNGGSTINANGVNSNGQEDCLYLNIFVPYGVYNNKTAKAPIYFFIHGGSFDQWATAYDAFEPSTLVAATNMIVVTVQYRLGSFGFMFINGTNAVGNQAILDQNLALKWVYNNAANFGGDNTRITIGGQSAGSQSVGYHLMFNASWPYFTNAILESGNPLDSVSQSLMSPTSALSKATQIGNALGCPTNSNQALFNCLLNANATLFNNAASPAWPYPPVVNDGVYFTQNPITAFNSGKVKKCNILTGSNSKEYAFFEQSLMPEPNPAVFTSTSLNTALQSAFKNVLTSFPNYTSASFISYILQTYNQINQLGKNATQLDYLIQIETDQKYKCPTVALSDIYSNLGSKVFTYFYDYRISTSNFAPKYLAVHKDELAMVFAEPLSVKQKPILNSNPWTSTKYNYSVAERTNSETIINFWSNFVATGDPNNYSAGKTTAWQKWSNNNANGIRNVFYIGGSNSNFNLTNIAYAETSDLICKTFNAGLV